MSCHDPVRSELGEGMMGETLPQKKTASSRKSPTLSQRAVGKLRSLGSGGDALVRQWLLGPAEVLSARPACQDRHPPFRTPVNVHIYGDSNGTVGLQDLTGGDGFGVEESGSNHCGLHAGVEVHGVEWHFSFQSGGPAVITQCQPREGAHGALRETLPMGCTCCSPSELKRVLSCLRAVFNESTFNQDTRSSNHFARALCHCLGVVRLPPSEISSLSLEAVGLGNMVYLTVYHLGQTVITRSINAIMPKLGAFHSAVELQGVEWSFASTPDRPARTGVAEHIPCEDKSHRFRERLAMGFTRRSEAEVQKIVKELKREWKGGSYNIFARNCHHFADAFCTRLDVAPPPSWLNDLARLLETDSETPTSDSDICSESGGACLFGAP